MRNLSQIMLISGCILTVAAVVLGALGQHTAFGPVVIAMFAAFGLHLQTKPSLKTFAFTVWVLAFVTAGLTYPGAFTDWGGFQLKTLIVPLIQIIMFGMGSTLSLSDFARVATMPRAVFVGIVLQFSVMPFAGRARAKGFGCEAGGAAGVVLIGSCPGCVASNVMTYLSRGNVALSVTMTACSTIVSPLATPLLMDLLAGEFIEIQIGKMMWNIVKIVLIPISAGLFANWAMGKLRLTGSWRDRLLSFVAMGSICFIIGIIVALSRDDLLNVAGAVIAAAVLHNAIGYILGYCGAWAARLDEASRRTVAIEVGLQNGGMATALATGVLANTKAAIAPAIFGPWMNVSGSILASWWRRRPVTAPDELQAGDVEDDTDPVTTS